MSLLKIGDEPLIGNPPRSFGQGGDSLLENGLRDTQRHPGHPGEPSESRFLQDSYFDAPKAIIKHGILLLYNEILG